MIHLDQHAEPNDIARTLWRELGPQTCIAIASTLAENTWYEDGGRYLYRYGANGSTVFDVWKQIGPLPPRRGRA